MAKPHEKLKRGLVPKQGYARKADIKRVVSAVKACGLSVAIDLLPDGTIRIGEGDNKQPQDEFERWEADGRL